MVYLPEKKLSDYDFQDSPDDAYFYARTIVNGDKYHIPKGWDGENVGDIIAGFAEQYQDTEKRCANGGA